MARAAHRKAAPPSAQMAMHIEPSTPVTAPAPIQQSAPVEPPPSRPLTLGDIDERYAPQRPAFGAWLLKQGARGGFVGALATAAIADRGFPKNGDVEAVRGRLIMVGADGDMFEALEDAESAWLAA